MKALLRLLALTLMLTPAFAGATTVAFEVNWGNAAPLPDYDPFIFGPFTGAFTAELEAGTNDFVFADPSFDVQIIDYFTNANLGVLSMTIVGGRLTNSIFSASANSLGFEGTWEGSIDYTSPFGNGTISSNIPASSSMLFIDYDSSFTMPGPDINPLNNGDAYVYVKGIAELTQSGNGGGTPVPEPSTLLLLGTGLVGLAAYRRRRA